MTKALELLRKLRPARSGEAEPLSVFDHRLQKLGGVRRVSVARAVLFRTQSQRQEA